MKKESIYLDNAATTRVCEEAAKTSYDIMRNIYGNPSSLHKEGLLANEKLKEARVTIADALGSSLRESNIVFTSGGTEANNLAIFGTADVLRRKGNIIVMSDSEHPSVNNTAAKLEKQGFTVKLIPTKGGRLDLDYARNILSEDVILISSMYVNNETGAVYDIPSLARLKNELCPNAYLHTDAVQAFMKLDNALSDCGADLITVTGHKIHGPKGVGALYIKKGKRISNLIYGGGQENNLRSGTESLPLICAFAKAAELSKKDFHDNYAYVQDLKEYLVLLIERRLPGFSIVKPYVHSPFIVTISVPNIRSEIFLRFLSDKGICISAGSACSSKHIENRVLTAFGCDAKFADSALRVSFSEENTKDDIDKLISALCEGAKSLIPVKFFS